MESEALLSALIAIEPSLVREEKADTLAVVVDSSRLLDLARRLQTQPFGFDLLVSHTAVHWPSSQQFELLYRVYSSAAGHSLLLLTRISSEQPAVESVSSIWRIAEWQEREVFDLFGVFYTNHPDLRRLFLEDDWQGFPLRKDYHDDFMLEGPE